MDIANFGVEEWLNRYETLAKYDLSQSTVDSLTLEEIIRLAGSDPHHFFDQLLTRKMNYGDIEGSEAFKEEVALLYKTVKPEQVLQTNGATGGNLLAIYALIEPGDHVLTTSPTYQQLSDIPRSLGAEVEAVCLQEEAGWRVPIEELIQKIRPNTKMITLNSANNPTGSVVETDELYHLVEVARTVGAYILVDEVYRPFEESTLPSIVDLYERGISVNSLSKTFSVPGIRVGWTASSLEVANLLRKFRDYTMICSGVLSDVVAVHVLRNRDKILERNRRIVTENYKILSNWIAQEERVSLVLPHLVSTSFIKINTELPIKEFCLQLLQKEGVLLVPGSAYGIEGHARLGYCCKAEVLQEGLSRISKFLRVTH